MDTSNNSYEQLYKKNCRWMWWKIFLKEDLERSPTLVILTIKKKIKIQVFRLWIICSADAGAAQVSETNQQEPVAMSTQHVTWTA